MKLPTLQEVGTEAKLLLIGIPVLIWTLLPIYHLFLFAISAKDSAFSGALWPDHPTLHNFAVVFQEQLDRVAGGTAQPFRENSLIQGNSQKP